MDVRVLNQSGMGDGACVYGWVCTTVVGGWEQHDGQADAAAAWLDGGGGGGRTASLHGLRLAAPPAVPCGAHGGGQGAPPLPPHLHTLSRAHTHTRSLAHTHTHTLSVQPAGGSALGLRIREKDYFTRGDYHVLRSSFLGLGPGKLGLGGVREKSSPFYVSLNPSTPPLGVRSL